MEKLLSILNNNIDKLCHFLSGYLISTVFPCPIHGLIASIIAAVSKEIYDSQHPTHTCDIWDAIATTCGGILGYAVMTWIK